MKRCYRINLQLYPADFKAAFPGEMLNVFEKAAEEHRGKGRAARVRFVVRHLISLVIVAGTEWIAKLTTSATVRGRCLSDPRSGNASSLPDEVLEEQRRIAILIDRMVHAIANHDFPAARSYSYEEREAQENLRRLRYKYPALSF